MAVPNDHIHTIQRRNFLRRTLRIAPGKDHPRPRTRPPHPPQKGAGVAVRLSRHAASIENHNGCGSQVASLRQALPARRPEAIASPSARLARHPKFST